VDGWDILKDKKKIFFLIKKFKFKNFLGSQNFINRVGQISEKEGHHPDISFGWGYAEIKITTHAIEGLSENDFILAAKIDQLINV
jgi:4a-hydroxytetrahydrobiopterin dehydratase